MKLVMLVIDEDIKNRREEYFYKLFNDGSTWSSCELEDLTISKCDLNRLFYRRIRLSEVRETFKRIENGKYVGSSYGWYTNWSLEMFRQRGCEGSE